MKKSDQYYITYKWMSEELGLKGDEIKVYAIIYGYQQKENKNFCGSAQYLADWILITLRGVQKIIKSLKEKGLLLVIKKSATRNEYRVIVPGRIDGSKKSEESEKQEDDLRTEFVNVYEHSSQTKNKTQNSTYEHSSQSLRTEFAKVYELSSYNNINNINNINSLVCLADKKSNIPSLEEVKEYVSQNNLTIDPLKFYQKNQDRNWITIKGDPVKNWKLLLRHWDRTEREEKNYQNAMMHTQYDYNEIEKNLLRN